MDYRFKIGTIEEIKNEEGEPVFSFEELWSPKKINGLYPSPKIIGIFQNQDHEIIETCLNTLEFYTPISEEEVDNLYCTEDMIPQNLIQIIYSPEILNEELLKYFIPEDKYKRLTFYPYNKIPDLNKKEKLIANIENNENLLELESLNEINNKLHLIQQKYGLTQLEKICSRMISKSLTFFK